MELSQVLFVGGERGNLAAVQVRCIDIAQRLGCDFVHSVRHAAQIPERYSAFICVKPALAAGELRRLAQRGKVVWDIIDAFPPREDVAVYLASSALTRHLFEDHGRVELIPHHHCNFENVPASPRNRRPAWIGSRHWLPPFSGFEFDAFFVGAKTRAEVAEAFRRSGIGLNFRGEAALRKKIQQQLGEKAALRGKHLARNLYDFHIAINSGIKLINCLGFGTPSVSSSEPAYHEFGEGCTIFSTFKQCARHVRELQSDAALYAALRQRCLRRAKKFHIDVIAEHYRQLIASLG